MLIRACTFDVGDVGDVGDTTVAAPSTDLAGTVTCSPSSRRAARLIATRSASFEAPPATASASRTMEPSGRVYTPVWRTAPVTYTLMETGTTGATSALEGSLTICGSGLGVGLKRREPRNNPAPVPKARTVMIRTIIWCFDSFSIAVETRSLLSVQPPASFVGVE